MYCTSRFRLVRFRNLLFHSSQQFIHAGLQRVAHLSGDVIYFAAIDGRFPVHVFAPNDDSGMRVLQLRRNLRCYLHSAFVINLVKLFQPSTQYIVGLVFAVSNGPQVVTNRKQMARMATEVLLRALRNRYWTPMGPQLISVLLHFGPISARLDCLHPGTGRHWTSSRSARGQ